MVLSQAGSNYGYRVSRVYLLSTFLLRYPVYRFDFSSELVIGAYAIIFESAAILYLVESRRSRVQRSELLLASCVRKQPVLWWFSNCLTRLMFL